MKRMVIVLVAFCMTGCCPVTQSGDPVVPEVYRKWREESSYYALIEIIDAHLANWPDYNRRTKEHVLKYLGEPNWWPTGREPGNEWAYKDRRWGYQGVDRHVPYGSKVFITFNDKDELIDFEWASE